MMTSSGQQRFIIRNIETRARWSDYCQNALFNFDILFRLKMLDVQPGFIIKILKRSLIDKFIKTRAFDCQATDWQSKARVLTNVSIRERFRIFILFRVYSSHNFCHDCRSSTSQSHTPTSEVHPSLQSMVKSGTAITNLVHTYHNINFKPRKTCYNAIN